MRPPFETMRRLEAYRRRWGTPFPRVAHRRNPPLPQLQFMIDQKRIELDDAEYFNYAAPVIASLRQQLAVLESQLAAGMPGYDVHQSELVDRRAQERAEWQRRQMQRNPYFPVLSNPLLAIVGNPGRKGHEVHPLAFEARDRYLADLHEPGHEDAAEYWRGQAGAFFTGNPPFRAGDQVTWSPEALELGIGRPGQVMQVLSQVHSVSGSHSRVMTKNGRSRMVNNWEIVSIQEARNPRGQELEHHCRSAQDRVRRAREDEEFGHLHQAHAHMEAAYHCCSNPPNPEELGVLDAVLAEIDEAEESLFAGLQGAAGSARKAVAGFGKTGSVKGKAKVRAKKVQKNSKAKADKPRKKRYSLEEARKKFKGFDKAITAYRRFHDREPGHVDVYELEDGESVVTVDDVHAALHRTLETNYVVPDGWDSNKNGAFWKHEHIEGAMGGKIDLQKRIEDLPLEVFDVKRNRTIKLPNGRWYLSDWWREKSSRGEHRKH